MTDSYSECKNSSGSANNVFLQAIETILEESTSRSGPYAENCVLPSGLRVTHKFSLAAGFSALHALSMYRSQFGEPPDWVSYCHPHHRSSLFKLALEKHSRLPDSRPQFIPYSLLRRLMKQAKAHIFNGCDNTKAAAPIETFFPLLIKDKKIRTAIEAELGQIAFYVMEKLKIGMNLLGPELYAHDIIMDIINNEYEVVDSLTGQGDEGGFPIDIRKYGPAYWVSACDFGAVGYFWSFENAWSWAACEYDELENED